MAVDGESGELAKCQGEKRVTAPPVSPRLSDLRRRAGVGGIRG